jgi:hypothetical protein
VASLADIRANDGNLSIPLYVRGKSVRDEKGEDAVEGLKKTVKEWEQNSIQMHSKVDELLKTFENS